MSARNDELQPITSISVEGFKSIVNEQTIDLRPLTVLAGVNSSGKSSMIQPLLLLKQTLECSYDPGPLLLNGPNAKFSKIDQLISKGLPADRVGKFSFRISCGPNREYRFTFKRGDSVPPLKLESLETKIRGHDFRILDEDTPKEFADLMQQRFGRLAKYLGTQNPKTQESLELVFGTRAIDQALMSLIHVPGLRGNPRRTYPLTAVGKRFPGRFESYMASVIAAKQHDVEFRKGLAYDLMELRLTGGVEAIRIDDTQIELLVGRRPNVSEGSDDLVSIADVGFGVSQTLPVVVALLTARPGQMVYIEQPEIHLHPRAQHAMANLLARAANRGVQIIMETHSSMLLLGIQSLVAKASLGPEKVKLHWFERDPQTGATRITSSDMDQAGRFGDWPEDFDEVALAAQQQYLDAAEKSLIP